MNLDKKQEQPQYYKFVSDVLFFSSLRTVLFLNLNVLSDFDTPCQWDSQSVIVLDGYSF